MSGSGANAELLLQRAQAGANYSISVIVTENPGGSRAKILSEMFNVPLLAMDMKAFYLAHGESSISLKTLRGQELRDLWSDLLRQELKKYKIDFILLAGFAAMTNVTGDYVALNVHPGDLSIEDGAGRRRFVGLHAIPVEKAILAGFNYLRSSVIVALPYSGGGQDEVDSGPILGVSEPMMVDFCGHTLAELREIHQQRKAGVKAKDALRDLAIHNQELLKYAGDLTVFPAVVEDYAAGRFRLDEAGLVYFVDDGKAEQQVKTIEYHADGSRKLIF
ncbi:MAG: hypothetical protein RRY34_03170 [Victivallaceae bacterium]